VEQLELGAPRVASLSGLAEEADGHVEEGCLEGNRLWPNSNDGCVLGWPESR
jgi:hypothetical protein